MGLIALGSGMALGEHEVTNEALARVCDTSDEWIRERTGIATRYYVADGTSTSDLGVRAAKAALADAKLGPGDIDYVVFATMTPDYYFPGAGGSCRTSSGSEKCRRSTSASSAPASSTACRSPMRSCAPRSAKRLLLVGAEVHSGFMPLAQSRDRVRNVEREADGGKVRVRHQYRDRTVLFGDGAGALVLEWSDDKRGLARRGAALRRALRGEIVRAVGLQVSAVHLGGDWCARGATFPRWTGSACSHGGVEAAGGGARGAREERAQARGRLAPPRASGEPAAQRSGAEGARARRECVYNNIQRYGNTTAATIPILYDECKRAGRIKRGDLLCFVALGAGFHWGAALWRE